jgi:hypothetical protein
MTFTSFWDATPYNPMQIYRLPSRNFQMSGDTPEEYSHQFASTLQTQSVSAGLGTQAVGLLIPRITPIT